MDHFGIGNAMKGLAHGYFMASRGTGRSTSLLDSLADGDRVVCLNSQEAKRLQRICQDRGINADFVVVDPRRPDMIFTCGTPRGRTIFDHSWVEQYYMLSIEEAASRLDHMQREASGRGAAHHETEVAMRELAKFRL